MKIVFIAFKTQFVGVLRPIGEEAARQGFEIEYGIPKNPNELVRLYGGDYAWPADCYIFNSGERPDRLREIAEKSIYTPHGIGDECATMGGAKAYRDSGVTWSIAGVLITGPKLYDEYVRAYQKKHTPEEFKRRFHLVGYPKLDFLFKPNEKDKIKKEMKQILDLPYEKTILFQGFYYYIKNAKLWMPILCQVLHKLLRFCQENPYNLIISPHGSTKILSDKLYGIPEDGAIGGYMTSRPIFDPDVGVPFCVFRDRFHDMKNVRWITPHYHSLAPFYPVSDLLVCADGSSIGFEFMTQDKPTVAIQEIPNKGFSLNPCLHATSSDLGTAINRSFSHPEEFHEQRMHAVQERIYKPDGHASERAVAAIKKIMSW